MRVDLEKYFKEACLEELQAIKPGNVHVFADGHNMTVQHFVVSAEAASKVIALQGLSLGERIYKAVRATYEAVSCNTNLGMILLSAPLIHARLTSQQTSLADRVADTLANSSLDDADLCFKAIVLANPAGLGARMQHDVTQTADCTLTEAMQSAAERDLVARQYTNGFTDVFDFGLTQLLHAEARWQKNIWAVTYVYLAFMANYPDSHIVRKYGEVLANEVEQEAQSHFEAFSKLENPKTYLGKLLQWDADLKSRKINPGTSADLTVVTLLANKMIREVDGYT